MELWFDAVLIVVIALLVDRFVGELPNRFHPLRWIGNAVGWLDRRIVDRSSPYTRLWGFLSYAAVFLMFWIVASAVCLSVRIGLGGYGFSVLGVQSSIGEVAWILVTAVLFKMSFAVFSFRRHCVPIQEDLRNGDTASAAAKVQMIVSRNTEGMDADHIASSCCETISENLVDSACSPAFYFGLFGITGAVMFRCANLMDAMWGYLNERYGRLGYFAARFDDVLGFVTSRLSPLFVAAAAWMLGMERRGVIDAARQEHAKTPSPNSGWPMTAAARALGISMEKKGVYVMGDGPMPTADDVTRCYHLVELTSILFMLVVTVPLFASIGIHVQLWVEDALYALAGMVL